MSEPFLGSSASLLNCPRYWSQFLRPELPQTFPLVVGTSDDLMLLWGQHAIKTGTGILRRNFLACSNLAFKALQNYRYLKITKYLRGTLPCLNLSLSIYVYQNIVFVNVLPAIFFLQALPLWVVPWSEQGPVSVPCAQIIELTPSPLCLQCRKAIDSEYLKV